MRDTVDRPDLAVASQLDESSRRFAALAELVPTGYTSWARHRPSRIMFDRGEGGRLVDVDGNSYVDCVLGMGPIVVGHGEAFVAKRLHSQLDALLVSGSESPLTASFARRACEWIPCAEQVVFANTGSEAVHLGLRIARATTGRPKVLRFEGHFHGWIDPAFTNGAAHGVADRSSDIPVLPNSAGQMNVHDEVIVARWNDAASLEDALSVHGPEIAAVIMEPVAYNAGGLAPYDGYLQRVRKLCTQHGVMLIFDEVITGFRLARGGAQDRYNVVPDLAIFAKAISGGLPLAMVAGSRTAMASVIDERVSTAGTFTANPLAIAAADAVTELIDSIPGFYEALDAKGVALRRGMQVVIDDLGVPFALNQTGSIVGLFSGTTGDRQTMKSALSGSADRVRAVVDRMARHGVFALPRGLFFLCYRHTDADLDQVTQAFRQSLVELVEEHII